MCTVDLGQFDCDVNCGFGTRLSRHDVISLRESAATVDLGQFDCDVHCGFGFFDHGILLRLPRSPGSKLTSVLVC